uniref:Putative secreted protein n=1 Tax=Ixodes ricinus TaxID=34613 RepID=A0A6B0U063_IXORI
MMVVLVTVVTVCLTVPSSCTSFTCVEVTTVSSEGLVLNAIVLANGSSASTEGTSSLGGSEILLGNSNLSIGGSATWPFRSSSDGVTTA